VGSYDVIACHQTFTGSKVGSQVLQGTSPDRLSVANVGTARVFSGDIHHPQRVGNVQYIGAPYQINFGDNYTGRVLYIGKGTTEVIENIEAPRKHLVTITSADIETSTWKKDIYSGDFVRVSLRVNESEVLDVDKLKARVRSHLSGVRDCGVLVSVDAPKRRKRFLDQGQALSDFSDASVFAHYCKRHAVSSELASAVKETYGI
jgi:hypothetical protein